MSDNELKTLLRKLKTKKYNDRDILTACFAIEDLLELRFWEKKVFQVYPNIDSDIEVYDNHGK